MLGFVHWFVYGYSMHGKGLVFCLAVGHGSNVAAWSCVKPGLEQYRGWAVTSLRTAVHYVSI